jgi:uncharacterized LabA/DUF88 family protein
MANGTNMRRLAVLIDADNTSARYAGVMFNEIATLGAANVRRIYGDFSGTRLSGWDDAIQSHAIVQHQQRSNTTGKNAADIALVMDAMDLLYKGKLDGFCLVSSDSDFTRLAQRLREDGLTVYGFGERKTPETFRNACTQFIYLENLYVEHFVDAPQPETASEQLGAALIEQATKAADHDKKKEPAKKAAPIIRKATAHLDDDDGWVPLSGVGSRILNIAPDFDPRSYGHAKLSALIEATGAFDLKRPAGKGVMIRLKATKKNPAKA